MVRYRHDGVKVESFGVGTRTYSAEFKREAVEELVGGDQRGVQIALNEASTTQRCASGDWSTSSTAAKSGRSRLSDRRRRRPRLPSWNGTQRVPAAN
jgi:hypothetical protein